SLKLAVVAPCGDDQAAGQGAVDDVRVVVGAYDVAPTGVAKVLGVGGSEGEEVNDDDAAVTPGAGKADHAPDGRIVVVSVRGRRVQADPADAATRGFPDARQGVAVAAAAAEESVGDHRRSSRITKVPNTSGSPTSRSARL